MEETLGAVFWLHTPSLISFSRISQAQLGEFLIQALPVNFQHMNHATANWAATLGQHSDDVLSSILGLSADQLAELRRKKVIA